MDLSGPLLFAVDLSGPLVFTAIPGPPVAVTVWGVWLALRGPTRPLGLALSLLGVGQLVVMVLSFSACSPFESDPCHGSSWTAWPEALILWGLCVGALLVGVAVALARATAGHSR